MELSAPLGEDLRESSRLRCSSSPFRAFWMVFQRILLLRILMPIDAIFPLRLFRGEDPVATSSNKRERFCEKGLNLRVSVKRGASWGFLHPHVFGWLLPLALLSIICTKP